MPEMTTKTILQRITEALAPMHPYKVILFGSYADGTETKDSDVDLLVVLDNKRTPRTFAERTELHSQVACRLRSIRKVVPMDLLVQSRPIYEKFLTDGGMFARQISEEGKVLYENDNQRVA